MGAFGLNLFIPFYFNFVFIFARVQTVMQHFILTYLFNHFIHLANYRFFLYPLEMSSRPLMTQDTGQLI